MANFIESRVVDPRYWLTQIDFQRGHASETLFVARTVKEVSSSLSVFRRDHPLSLPTLPWQIRYAIFIGIGMVWAAVSFLPTVDDLKKSFQPGNNTQEGISWGVVTGGGTLPTLPRKITPSGL